MLLCDGEGEASNLRFTGVLPGDEVHVDNHAFLAFCYFYRHHLMDSTEWDFLRVDGTPIYPQYEQPLMSPFMGTVHTGRFDGKMLWVHHTHDASLWPSQGIGMKNNVERERGVEGARGALLAPLDGERRARARTRWWCRRRAATRTPG